MIQIYKKDTTNFKKNGDMTLFPTKCKLSAKLNGSWVLDMIHPLDSMGRWKHLEEEAIIVAPTFMGKKQLFRIDELEKTDTEIAVIAYPIFFDSADDCFLLDRRPEIKNGQQALDIMMTGTKYRGESNISTSSTAYFVRRNLMDCINGEDSPTFVQRWGGEILYDNYKVIINERAGGDYRTEIRYGKNMDGISYKLDLSETITRILPAAYNGHTLPGDEPWVDSPLIGKYAKVYAKEMKFDDVKLLEDANEDDSENGIIVCATKEELYAALVKKCEEQFNLGVDLPKVTIDVNMVDLSNTEEYKEFESLEKVGLGDTVHCKHRILDITTDARCIELTWDCIRNVAEEMTLGEFEYDYFTEFSSTLQAVEKILGPNNTVMAERVRGVLNAINTQLRYQKNAAQRQDVRAILFEDLNKDSPMYGAMCLGTQGFQISNKRTADGRDWEWSTAFTAHGGYADTIISGTISDKKGRNYWNLDTGEFRLTSGAYIGDETIEDYVGNASDKSLSDFVNGAFKDIIEDLKDQSDKKAEIWYQETDPSLGWTKTEFIGLEDTIGEKILDTNFAEIDVIFEKEKSLHFGDIWKNSKTNVEYIYKDGEWVEMPIPDDVFDMIDGKAQIFIEEPVPPYAVGDVWFTGTTILVCNKERESGLFTESDWGKKDAYTDNTALYEFIEGDYLDTIKMLQSQTDKKSETWYQSEDPSTSWTSTELKNEHIGDMWFNTTTKKSSRWNGTKWEDMTTPVPDEVYDKIDGKAQVFVTTPKPPYDVGDLWFDSETSDIMTCIKSRETGTFSSKDWEKRNKYTDDSYAQGINKELNKFISGYKNEIKNIQSQVDQKAETWYQTSDPALKWTGKENIPLCDMSGTSILDSTGETITTIFESEKAMHDGDLWHNPSNNKEYIYKDGKWNESSIPDDVFDMIDGKARIFVSTPVPPYDVGDLWFDSETYDIMTCIKSRETGTFSSKDWEKRNKYTDDSAVESLDEKLTQKEIFNRLTDNGNAQGIYMKDGDLYINAEFMVSGFIMDKEGKSYWDLDSGNMMLTGVFSQVDGNGYKSVDIYNNQVRFFDWNKDGNYVGSIGATRIKDNGKVGINMWCDQGDYIYLGYNNGSADPEKNITNFFGFDSKTPDEPPWIINTSTGNFLTGGVSVTVKNGLITDIPSHTVADDGTFSVISGMGWDIVGSDKLTRITRIDRLYVTVKKGVITKWEEKSEYQ